MPLKFIFKTIVVTTMVFFVSILKADNTNRLYELFQVLETQPDSFYVRANSINVNDLNDDEKQQFAKSKEAVEGLIELIS